jgi:hypothetical protein
MTPASKRLVEFLEKTKNEDGRPTPWMLSRMFDVSEKTAYKYCKLTGY